MNRSDKDQLDALLGAMREDVLDAAGFAQLQHLIATDDDARCYYIEYVMLVGSLRCQRPEIEQLSEGGRPSAAGGDTGGADRQFPSDKRPIPAEQSHRQIPQPYPQRRLLGQRAWVIRGMAAAIVALAACLAIVAHLNRGQATQRQEIAATRPTPASESTQVGQIAVLAGAVWEQSGSTRPNRFDELAAGTQLPAHRLLRLRSGGAEVVFDSGARVVLEGPADFRLDGRNRGTLEFGKLVAHVPPLAHGFAIVTPRAQITDHGTVFGVNVSANGSALVHMYEGSADMAILGAEAQSQPSPVALHGGNVIAQDVAGALSWVDGTDPQAFPDAFAVELRDVRIPLALHSTGAGLPRGAADPYWQIISTPPLVNFQPGNAIVAYHDKGVWPANDPKTSQWLSIRGDAPDTKDGHFIFRATVDLTGFDPNTVRIRANIVVDDAVDDIRINGKSTGIRLLKTPGTRNYTDFHSVTMNRGFAPGINQIDFVVWNEPAANGPKFVNAMGLRVEWEGDALPEIAR